MKATLTIEIEYVDSEESPDPAQVKVDLHSFANAFLSAQMEMTATPYDSWAVHLTTTEDEPWEPINPIQLWKLIDKYAAACGAKNLRNPDATPVMCDIEQCFADWQEYVQRVTEQVASLQEKLGNPSLIYSSKEHGNLDIIKLIKRLERDQDELKAMQSACCLGNAKLQLDSKLHELSRLLEAARVEGDSNG